MNEKKFFNQIQDQDLIINYLKNNTIDCILKYKNNFFKTCFVKIDDIESDHLFVKNKSLNFYDDKIFISFESAGDIFFFETLASSQQDIISVEIPSKIFKIQRRNTFRLSVPKSLKSEIKMHLLDQNKMGHILEKNLNIDIQLKDLSLGGCKLDIFLNSNQISSKKLIFLNQQINLQIKFLDFDFDENTIGAVIKHIDNALDSNTYTIGLKFIELSAEHLRKLNSTLLKLDRLLRYKTQD